MLSNGAWVFPIYWQECCGAWDWKLHSVPNDGIDENWPFRCGVLRTEDNGKSFHIEGYLKAQTPLWENNIAEYENGKLVMLMRAEFTDIFIVLLVMITGKHGANRKKQIFQIQHQKLPC